MRPAGHDPASGSEHEPQPAAGGSWTFLTNHGHVLLTVAMNPDVRVKDLALTVGITTRHALLILRDLEAAGYVHRERVGRVTHYTVNSSRPFRHPTAAAHQVQELIAIFTGSPDDPERQRHVQPPIDRPTQRRPPPDRATAPLRASENHDRD